MIGTTPGGSHTDGTTPGGSHTDGTTPGGSHTDDAASGGSHADETFGEAGSTGDLRVDAALARLEELAELPVTSHVEVFENVHRQLHEALTALDEG